MKILVEETVEGLGEEGLVGRGELYGEFGVGCGVKG